MPPAVRVELLGPVRAVGEGGQLTLRGKTARTVLARLALSAGSIVSVDQLTDALWFDDPPLNPSLSLRSIISRLRTQLGRHAIVTDGPGYRLDTALVDVDLAEIEATIKGATPGTADPQELEAKLAFWRGDALADVAWTPVFEPERARIDELRSQLLDRYHEAMLDRGRATEALPNLERDAASAPLRESRQLLLMRALAACGRTADALRVGDQYRSRLVEETGLDPSPDHDALTRALLAPDDLSAEGQSGDQPAVTPTAVVSRTWVPPDTPFVGRETELLDLAHLVASRRLVTIIGPGGVGKTRLITEFMATSGVAAGAVVEMVSLAPLDRSTVVDNAVATALGIEVSSAESSSAIAARLSARPSTLVLDNCEHVLSSVRLLVQHLLREVENLRIITTSRRRLGLADEALLDVGPLAVIDENAADGAPMRLFMDRVERSARSLTVTDQDRANAADICRLVDGLPLALELAAARVTMFGFDGLRQRLVDGLAIPGSRVADDDRRQATIESTVEWSLTLLSPKARQLFDDLSIFPSWFDLPGLEQVSESEDVVDAFGEILDSSLVMIDHNRRAYRLLEPVRQVAARQIDGERRDLIVTRYIAWMSSVVDAIDQNWIDDERAAAQQLVISHRADIRSALKHLAERGNADSHGRFAYVLARALVDRADAELIDLCRVDVGPSLKGELARCMLAWHQGDLDVFVEMAEDIETRIDVDNSLWSYFHWIRAAGCLYLGDVEATANAASIAANDERGFASMRSESVGLWALGLLYNGRREEAAAVLVDNEHLLAKSGSGGFVAYTRAEVVAAENPELAISYLSESSAQGAAATATFTQRLTDVSRLVLLIAAERSEEAVEAALQLIPELTRTGTYPQAWTAMRHIAALLGQLGHPDQGLLVLESANTDPSAPAVTGDAVEVEDRLRNRLAAQIGDDERAPQPTLALIPLWEQVATVLGTTHQN